MTTIITQHLVARPLEKWINPMIHRVVILIHLMTLPLLLPQFALYRQRVRAAWRALNGFEAHHGAELLFVGEDSLHSQPLVAKAVGDTERAQILQKMYEWIQHNKREGRAASTYNGYQEWVQDHFSHMSTHTFGRHVRELEKLGVLITERLGNGNQKKVYRIDRGRLNGLVSQVKQSGAEMNVADSRSQKADSKAQTRDSNLNHDSKRNQSSNSNLSTQEPPTKSGRGGRRAGAGRKPKGAVTASNTDSSPLPTVSMTVPLKDGDTMTPAPNPSPRSAAPSPHAALMARMAVLGLDEGKVWGLIETYSADRVRAVVHRCEQRLTPQPRTGQRIENPAGWIVAELKNDVFKLGVLTADEEHVDQHGPDLPADAPIMSALPLPDEAAVSRWQDTLVQLQPVMAAIGPAAFVNSVADSVLVGYDTAEGVYHVRTADRDHVQCSRFHADVITQTLTQVHGGVCRVTFEGGTQ